MIAPKPKKSDKLSQTPITSSMGSPLMRVSSQDVVSKRLLERKSQTLKQKLSTKFLIDKNTIEFDSDRNQPEGLIESN